jgi:hypothetical protein
MNLHPLHERKRKELAQIAKHAGVLGWHGMSKAQLVAALTNIPTSGFSTDGAFRKDAGRQVQLPSAPAATRRVGESIHRDSRDPAAASRTAPLHLTPVPAPPDETDRVIVLARDPFWLHVYWAISCAALQRGRAALGKDWYGARPILRLYEVARDEAAPGGEVAVRDIPIHSGVQHWYVDVASPTPKTYRVDVGLLTVKGRFLALAHSNLVATLAPAQADRPDEAWQRIRTEFDRRSTPTGCDDDEASLVDLFEERTRRPLRWGAVGAGAATEEDDFAFAVDAEVVLHGSCDPAARVLLQNEPIALRPDGTFSVRFGLSEGRQIIPAVALRRDGEERTVILAIERNTKVLEPAPRDGQEG